MNWPCFFKQRWLNIAGNLYFFKRGQALGAFYFVMMLALFLVIYIVLLPAQEKQLMMGEIPAPYPAYNTVPGAPLPSNSHGIIFSDYPGSFQPYALSLIQKNLASIDLYSIEDKQYETLAGNILVESTLVKKDKAEFIFEIDDENALQDVKLLFFVAAHDGEMTIKLNGIKILSGEIVSDMLPVELPISVLGKANRLTFETSAPGLFAFMSKNSYLLKDVVLIKNYLIQNNYETRQFVLSQDEIYDLNRMSLIFRPNCMTLKDAGRLGIRLNGKLIHDAEIVCDAGIAEIDFSPADLIEGRNILEFGIDSGQYVLENVVLEGDYSSADFYKESFIIGPAEIDALRQGAKVVLQARFANDGYRKGGTFYINGFPVYFDTSFSEYTADLNGLVYEGKNFITIIPDTPFEMVSLDIFLA